jgi:hypothetical protein
MSQSETTPAESPAAKRIARTDQGHLTLSADATAEERAEAFRLMAVDQANVAAESVQERRRTNDELEKIRAQLTVGIRMRPPRGYGVLVAVVGLLVLVEGASLWELARIITRLGLP